MAAVTGQGGERRRRRQKRKRISVLIHGGCASSAPVPSLQWHCQRLAWAHSGLLTPTVPWRNAWNVLSPILPVSLQCCSADVTNCRRSAQAPSCCCSTTLPPSCAFSFQHKASSRPCPDPPAPILWISPHVQHGHQAGAVRQSRPFTASCVNVLLGSLASLCQASLLWSEVTGW